MSQDSVRLGLEDEDPWDDIWEESDDPWMRTPPAPEDAFASAALLQPPPAKPGDFQKAILDFFLSKPVTLSSSKPSLQTTPPPTLGPAMSGRAD